jgi:hypothetical protein
MQLPHSRFMALAKAMGLTELQLQMAQVSESGSVGRPGGLRPE